MFFFAEKILFFYKKIFFRNIFRFFRRLKIANFRIWQIPDVFVPTMSGRPAQSKAGVTFFSWFRGGGRQVVSNGTK